MADLITLAALSGSSAYDPDVLIADAQGDLFGATEFGGAVFEVAKTAGVYASTPTILVSLGSSGDYQPIRGLITDSDGNVIGTDEVGNTVFEVAKTTNGYATTPTTLVSLSDSGADSPVGALIKDKDGDLFGTTEFGGSDGAGTVFEIAKTGSSYASTATILVNLTGDTGAGPSAGLTADTKGDLFGTTTSGGANNDGTVFELAKTTNGYASAPTVLANFDSIDGTSPQAGLIVDTKGDLFGTTTGSGTDGGATVFEIAKTANGYDSTPTILASFTSSISGGLIEDAKGDLFGTTASGGASDYGTVFEIAKTSGGYASSPTILISFDSTDGSDPDTGLIADADGDLFGATGAGADNGGTVFEVTNTGYAVPCFCGGTMIATPHGDVAVEHLVIGDPVVTAGGAIAPVRWIGRRTLRADGENGYRFADPLTYMPIRIKAGALGANIPVRDLLVSADHALLVEDILIQAGALVNGVSILREKNVPETFTYYHVELADHALILADGAPAETFVDNISRMGFDNWAEHEALYGSDPLIAEMPYPRALSHRQVPMEISQSLWHRACAMTAAHTKAVAA